MRGILVALLVMASPAAAQSIPGGQQPALPAKTRAPTEQARHVFDVLQAHVMTDEVLDSMIRSYSESTKPMDEAVDHLLAPGEQVRDWQNSGIDLLAAINGHEGGPTHNMTEAAAEFGPSLVYFQDRPIESFVRPEWVLVGRRGTQFEGDDVRVEIGHVSPKVILAERVGYRRLGNAYCRTRAESRLYADPAVPASELDTFAVILTMRTLATMEHQTLCAVTEDLGQGQYRLRWFDSEGHRLAMDQPLRIVPIVAAEPAAPQ